MRRAIALFLLALASRAEAETIPIAIVPFSTRCFDADKLATRVRAEVGELPVSVGAAARGSHHEVAVSEKGESLLVVVTARGPRREVSGSARRLVPAADCTTALEVTALIVTRAALPLNWQKAPPVTPTPPRPPPSTPTRTPRTVPRDVAEPPPSTEPAPPRPAEPAPVAEPAPMAPAPPRPFVAPPRIVVREEPRAAPREPGTIVLRTRFPERRLVGELGVAAYGWFPLDGNGADEPGGELSLGFRRRRFGAAVRGAVEGDFTESAPTAAGPVTLSIRRTEVALEAHVDVPVRFGALRFVVGPAMPLWIVRSSGALPHPRSSLIVSAAASTRILYRIDLRRVFLTAGVSAEVAFLREQLTVTGLGKVGETPLVEIGPFLGFGVNL